ncbi:MAG: alpha/beta fold hydrolase [Gemmatimonadota bacterium]|nr:alpha/beta fold hydrolase [Gemmatimonadota bacterium]
MRPIARRWRVAAAALAAAALVILLGPRTGFEERWNEPEIGPDVEAYLAARESNVPDLRPGEAKAVVWADPAAPGKTPIALVYLHGFSADRHEVDPLAGQIAAALGANVFYTRLTGHARDDTAMAEATVEAWMDDAAEAVAVGARLGNEVVLVGTSTGGTLALWAAARSEAAGRVAALALISPNLHPKDRTSRILLWPWGGQIARLVTGPKRCFEAANAEESTHWTVCYPTSVLLPMMALVEHVRTMPLDTITVPTIVAYSAKDAVVDPAETLLAYERLGSPHKQLMEILDSGDHANHVLAGDIMSPGTTDEIARSIVDFLRQALPES